MVPNVYSLIFDPIVKEELKKAQAASFDGQLLVGDLAYGSKLQAWIDGNLARFPKDKHEKVTFLHDEAKTDKALSSLLDSLQDDLKLLLAKKAPPELDQIWTMERKRHSGKAPRAKDTFVRRGLSKEVFSPPSSIYYQQQFFYSGSFDKFLGLAVPRSRPSRLGRNLLPRRNG